jgi:hypothetical protein
VTIVSLLLLAVVGVAQQAWAAGAGPRASAASFLGDQCIGSVFSAREKLTLIAESTWPTDSWTRRSPSVILPGTRGHWESEGGAFRGCHAKVRYSWDLPGHGGRIKGTVEFWETHHYNGQAEYGSYNPEGLPLSVERAGKNSSAISVSWKVS